MKELNMSWSVINDCSYLQNQEHGEQNASSWKICCNFIILAWFSQKRLLKDILEQECDMPAVGFNFRKTAATARLSEADLTLEFDNIFKKF